MRVGVNITGHNAALIPLGELATVRAGYAFRSAIPESADGDVLALQLRDIGDDEEPNWSGVLRTTLPRAPSPTEWLRSGDILFSFRGARFVAVALDNVPGPSVAATQFMLIRVRDSSSVVPAFLAWQLNQGPAQSYFRQVASGTAVRSLRRGAIEALQVAVPPIEVQQLVVTLVDLVRRERAALAEAIEIRKHQLNGIATSLLAIAQGGFSK